MLKRITSTLLITLVVAAGSPFVFALDHWSGRTPNSTVSFFNLLPDTDRDRDGLVGPVRRVRTETAKLLNKGGKLSEGPRAALETAAYDIKGSKVENAYFPVAGAALTGKEVYKYDDKGNITEMTLLDPSGTLLSKEVYAYEFDSFGNWTKMTTSIAVIEGGKINFEPTEVTYRSITYYLDEATLAKMSQPTAAKPAPAPSNVPMPNVASAGATLVPGMVNHAFANKPAPGAANPAAMAEPPPAAAAGTAPSLKTGASAPETTPKADVEAPKPAVARAPVKPISGGVLNGKATSLPVPTYPVAARSARATGLVTVEVVIDGSGKVISAKANSGHPLLQQAAVQAAQQARFTPTLLSGQPVKISGLINYNFALQK